MARLDPLPHRLTSLIRIRILPSRARVRTGVAFPQCSAKKSMEPETSSHREQVPNLWWAVWLVTLLTSIAPLWIHYSRNVPAIIEPLRYPWGLLPAHFLMFRWLGEIFHWIAGSTLAVGVIARARPGTGHRWIAAMTCVVLIFLSLYGAFLGTLVSEGIIESAKHAEYCSGPGGVLP